MKRSDGWRSKKRSERRSESWQHSSGRIEKTATAPQGEEELHLTLEEEGVGVVMAAMEGIEMAVRVITRILPMTGVIIAKTDRVVGTDTVILAVARTVADITSQLNFIHLTISTLNEHSRVACK